jgi:GNAT superfamily N-acetyltransferase
VIVFLQPKSVQSEDWDVSDDHSHYNAPMELTIAPQSYRPSDDSLILALKQATLAMSRMVSQETQLDGTIALSNPDAPLIRQANRAASWDGTPGSFTSLIEHYTEQQLNALVIDSEAALLDEAQIQLAKQHGYKADTRQLLVMAQFIAYDNMNTDLQVIPARAAYRETKAIYARMAQTDFGGDAALTQQLCDVMVNRLDEPRLDLFLGRMDRKPVALCGVYTQGQTGVLVPVYVDPDMRGKRLGITMLNHVLEHCARAQLQQVILDRSPGCYAIPMYEKAGFVTGPKYMRLLKHVG